MNITPLDVLQQQFKGRIFGGLDPDEVDGFLQQVSQEMELLIRENNDLKEQNKKALAVHNIKLVWDDATLIEGRVEGQHIYILTQYVKKTK